MIQLLKKINWILLRIKDEFIKPNKKIIYLISFSFQILRIIIEKINKFKSEEQVLVWDIRNNAITFDFVWTVFYTFYRFKMPKKGFKLLIFIPKEYNYSVPKYNSYNSYVSSKDLINRIDKLILPLAKSFTCINRIEIISNKKKLQKFIKYSKLMPRFYHPDFFYPAPLCYLGVHKILRKEKINIDNFMNVQNLSLKVNNYGNFSLEEKFITITLRDYGYSPGRNSSQKDIDIAYAFSLELNCKIILIPDDISKLNNYNIYDINVFESGRHEISHRLMCYTKSLVNLIQPSGPAGASTLLKNSKTIITNYGKGTIDDNYQYFKKFYNLELGDQPYLSLGTYLMWFEKYKYYSVLDLKNIMKVLDKK